MNFGFYTSENKGGSRYSMAWDKYGRRQNKTEHISPGMYIMFNTGSLSKLNHSYKQMKVGEGHNWRKISLQSNLITLELTIKVSEPFIVNSVFEF